MIPALVTAVLLWLSLFSVRPPKLITLVMLDIQPTTGVAPLAVNANISILPAFTSGTVCVSKGFNQTNVVTECWPIEQSHRWTKDIWFVWSGDWTVDVEVRGRLKKKDVSYRTPPLRLHVV